MDKVRLRSIRTNLLKCELDTLPAGGRLDLVTSRSEIPTGAETGRHHHPYATVVYVLEGLFRLEVGEHGEAAADSKAGEVFSEPAGQVVTGRALAPTKLLVVLPKEPNQPESVAAEA